MHYIEGFDANVEIYFNDNIPFDSIMDYDKVILSPGPGLPKDAGQLPKFIKTFHDKTPILGVCLGFQALVEYYGGTIYNQDEVKHGVQTNCSFENNSTLFKHTATNFKVGLYHSWAANKDNFPKSLNITAQAENGVIMAFEHSKFPVYGVQFHPESILSEYGHQIIQNFLFN